MSFFLKVGRDGASKNAGEEVDSYSPAEYEGLCADNCITPAMFRNQADSFVCCFYIKEFMRILNVSKSVSCLFAFFKRDFLILLEFTTST